VKAYYRAASASLALDKLDDARDANRLGLAIEPSNTPLKALHIRITKREQELDKLSSRRKAREAQEARTKNTLISAFKHRKLHTHNTTKSPNMDDAIPILSDPSDPTSTLSLPVLFLYPLAEQTDLIKQFEETHSLNDHLAYMLPTPWDKDHEYVAEALECYMSTPSGGLVKAGKKLPLSKIFETGKIEMVDGMLKVYIVPRTRALTWIASYKERRVAMGS
jgi:hypothetical protein